jgi:hypothetical protein
MLQRNISVIDGNTPGSTEDGRFPAQLDRDYEEQLLDLCASGDVEPKRWRGYGPPFFMAGLAVMLASVPEFDRRSLLDLAEACTKEAASRGLCVVARTQSRPPVAILADVVGGTGRQLA